MKRILLIFILTIFFSCKENKVNSIKKIDYVDVDGEGNAKNTQKISEEIEEIGNLYQPERMAQEEIKKSVGKSDYQYTLTNSELLDTDIKNLKNHSRKVVSNYYKFLNRINVPFNYDKIIVKIIHRNGKEDIFEYSEKEMLEITK